MANLWWNWEEIPEFRELVVDFTIHSDPGNFSTWNGLYLMVCQGSIVEQGFYFGLQTDVSDPQLGRGRGKGLIFSRWGERDLSFARIADEEEGWTESAGYEGNFISVRRSYGWGVGDYRMRLAPHGKDDDGEWYALWITDAATDTTTWAGSLKFPFHNGTTAVRGPTYTTLEIYGNPIRPIDIPEWHVSMKRPMGDGVSASWGNPDYSPFKGEILNSDVQYDRAADIVHFRVGGITRRVGSPKEVQFR